MNKSIKSRLSWRLTFALIVVFALENLVFIGYHVVEYWNQSAELLEDIAEFGVLLMANLLALPIMLFVARFLIKRELEPLEAAAATAESIQSGQLSRRIEVENPPEEIRKLAEVFNAAFDQYHGLLEKAQQFNIDASHQLRTPLAIMRTTGEVALSQKRDDREYREVIGSMLEETDHLQRIVAQLLDLAKISHQAIETTSIQARDLLQRVIDRFTPVLEDCPGRVSVQCDESLVIHGSEPLLVEALSNLVDNAITHTPEGKPIRLSAVVSDAGATLQVLDSGPGIPPELISRLTDRFFQQKQGGARGSGLGLAIVKAIAELHGGSVGIASDGKTGTCVSIHLPASPPRRPSA